MKRNGVFPKEKPIKPEREQVVRRYNPVLSQLKTGLYKMVQAADCDWTSVYCRNDFICNTTIINVYDPIDFCRYFFDWSLCYLYHILQSCDFPQKKKKRMKNVSAIPENIRRSAANRIRSMTKSRRN